jgi:phosphohistidine swiveling domain-containing protein
MMTASASGGSARLAPSAHVYSHPLEFESEPSRVGEKAATLGRMLRAGVRVPPGFVLTTRAFDSHLDMNDLRSRIEAVSAGIDPRDPAALRMRSQHIRMLIVNTRLSHALRDELFESADRMLARGAVVVRSSAIGEDSAGHSFAGQLDSILNVTNEAALERAVLDCWASYWSERALFYCNRSGITRAGMGVVIQQQVEARAAGVLFTDAGDGSMLVEYAAGLGDALVSGAINPGRLSIARKTGVVRHVARPPHGGDDLLENAIDALVAAGTKLEQDLGGPQDIEWALDHRGNLFVVQSRPITAPVVARPSASSSAKRVAWSNANINENFPGPVSPLLYSIASVGYTHYFRNLARAFGISKRRIQAMEPSFRQIIGVHGARMYYNLSSIHSVLRLAPFGQALTESFDTFVGADGSSVDVTPVPQSGTAKQVIEACAIAAKTTWQFLLLGRRVVRFETTVDRFAARTDPARLASMSIADLRAALGEFMEIRRDRWLDASLADAASMICYGALERLLRLGKSARGESDAADVMPNSLLTAIPDVISGEPVHRLWALSRLIRADQELQTLFQHDDASVVLDTIATAPRFAAFRDAFRQYVDQWGFRCSEELMLTSPSFQENPAPLVAMLRAYATIDGASPDDVLEKQETARIDETKRVLAELSGRPSWRGLPGPSYARLVRLMLPWTHAAIRFRERARMKQSLLYSRCRRIALAIGDELVQRGILPVRDDIFFLTVSEIDELTAGTAMFPRGVRELVAIRARAHAGLARATPPDAFTLGEGEYLATDYGTVESSDAHDATREPVDGELRGAPACGGRITGRAVVLHDVIEAGRLQPGDILVTKQTDPGWAPVFFLISGLVIERGGMLSHGAIIAREFGIPCVVGVQNAMKLIPTGATITVDADAGRVHVVR